ncbi:glycogen debranching enzyme protein [Pleurostoma richardsiae]|uniref:Glycogen debranching enzyme protein n=1 Tax=Pleurostoma richardsiae TaxID=41990 RepID=A0AA38S8P5_9PEZI|nr:glycogen debranching enzyme protein [Pleurostoma richardsiae]
MRRGKMVHPASLSAEGTSLSSSANEVAPGTGELVVQGDRPAKPRPHLPKPLQFPLVAILSLSISSLGYSILNEYTEGELANISRTLDSWPEIALLALWRLFELALGWFARFDSFDLASLNLLSHGPTVFLMFTFYNVRRTTAIACLTIDIVSSFLPFLLLRPLSRAHSGASSIANREIIVDKQIRAYTTALAGAIYCVVLYFAYQTYLPSALVVYFEGLPTVEPAHSATTPFISASTTSLALAFGLAARVFIFTPFEATGHTSEDDQVARFDPVEASLKQTLLWNLWGYTTQTKVAILRTAVVMVTTFANTFLQCAWTINGVEPTGAAIYASVWVAAALFTGIALRAVGKD